MVDVQFLDSLLRGQKGRQRPEKPIRAKFKAVSAAPSPVFRVARFFRRALSGLLMLVSGTPYDPYKPRKASPEPYSGPCRQCNGSRWILGPPGSEWASSARYCDCSGGPAQLANILRKGHAYELAQSIENAFKGVSGYEYATNGLKSKQGATMITESARIVPTEPKRPDSKPIQYTPPSYQDDDEDLFSK